ncbi:hypothetical protein GGR51DRAFT_502139 [Nemania sp. FL0031]|nr:hypothetical protein GGR51DRAFT_502139 [Nemania sp. FL0031]
MSSSNFICVQCTRRLGHLAQSSKSLNNSPIVLRQVTPPTQRRPRKPTPLLVPRCSYSTRPGSSVGRRLVPTRDHFTQVRFTLADVPPKEFWAEQATSQGLTDLRVDECLRVVQAYAALAIKNTPGWRERHITMENIDIPPGQIKTLPAYGLHLVGVILAFMKPTDAAAHMGVHIFHTLACLDYAPSILTLLRSGQLRRVLGEPQFEPALEGLERILRRIDDNSSRSSSNNNNKKSTKQTSETRFAADACTLRGLIYAAENTKDGDTNALRWFRRAYEINSAAPTTTQTSADKSQGSQAADPSSAGEEKESGKPDQHWQWKASFALGVAAIRMKRGELAKARAMYEMASSELDDARGYLGMANLLEKMGEAGTEKYTKCLEKAAISGNAEAMRKMGARERERAAEDGLSKWERRKRQVIAEEWMAVGSGVSAASEV